jgi:hypothetical protein
LHIDRTNAERQKRYRMRQNGLLCVATVELPYGAIVTLVERGFIIDASDPNERAAGVEKFILESIGHKITL